MARYCKKDDPFHEVDEWDVRQYIDKELNVTPAKDIPDDLIVRSPFRRLVESEKPRADRFQSLKASHSEEGAVITRSFVAESVDIEEYREHRLEELKNRADKELLKLENGYPAREVIGWSVQQMRAGQKKGNPNVASPMLDRLAERRGQGESAAQVADKIEQKAAAYELLYADIVGTRHALEQQILAAKTLEAIDAIAWPEVIG